ncbi:MAG: FdhF/YdeP family oxidoreductase [Cyclobacteriaceae bacterium]|nr:FdhF/YdeP family oxidoreductase [Cyclobacteriaceae bacterium]
MFKVINFEVGTEKKLKIKSPKTVAGGIPSVISSLQHVAGEVGWVEGTKVLLKLNQFDGMDCPGCAWPDPDDHRSAVEFCENGAKAIAEEATTARCDPDFFRQHSISAMQRWTDFEIGKSGRMTHPMIVREGQDHYEPITWADAFHEIGEKLRELSSPHEAVFYTSGRTSNEAAFLYQLFVRMYGTNNLPDCSNMCHESSGVALTETVGIGKGSVKLDDFYKAEVIVVMGQNPGTNHPRMLTALQQAKKNGAKIISINPLAEAGLISFRHPQHPLDLVGKPSVLTDVWLPVKINEDVALLKAMLKILVEKERREPGTVFDHDFIRDKTNGLELLLEDLKRFDVDQLILKSGVAKEKVFAAAEILAGAKKIIVCWAMGLTQHKNAVDNIREIVNLLLLKGSIGKPGAGTCPVRGHSNVQGDRTMGIYEKPSKQFLDNLQRVFDFEPPRESGYDTVESIQAIADGKVNVFFAMGGNFLSATPDTGFTAKALQQCDLTVQVSTKLNRSHLVHGKQAIILPCLGRTEVDVQEGEEQFVSVENSAGVVHASRGSKKPVSEHLWSEPKIVAALAKAVLRGKDGVDWDKLISNYDAIRDLIEKTIPGFEQYNQRVRKDGGFYLPNAARDGNFNTPSAKAVFTINAVSDHVLQEKEFLLMTIRSHDQYNTTIYGMDDRYRGIYQGRRVVFLNAVDMEQAKLQQGDVVDMVSNYDSLERRAKDFVVVSYDIPQQCAAAYFPEANEVIPYHQVARGSQTPISKSVVIRLEKKS